VLSVADLFIAALGPVPIFSAPGLFAMPCYMGGDLVVLKIVACRPMATGWRARGVLRFVRGNQEWETMTRMRCERA